MQNCSFDNMLYAVVQIGFTGSTAVGKKIAAVAAASMTPVTMECGGKNPLIICADANIDEVRALPQQLCLG